MNKYYRSPYATFSVSAAVIISVIAYYISRLNIQPLFIYLLAINSCTVLYYGYDKMVAGRQLTRIPEKILHGLAILGGSPAALLSQRIFRHKTSKKSFQVAYWLIVGIQTGLLIWYLV